MHLPRSFGANHALLSSLLFSSLLGAASGARADAVTDWNAHAVAATKGFVGTDAGSGTVTLDSNFGARIEAIEARAVYDAVNALLHFSERSYYYDTAHVGSAPAAVAQAAHDVLLGLLPNPTSDATVDARWSATRAWVDRQLAADLSALGVAADDGGLVAGREAAAAALRARQIDGAGPVTTYGAQLSPTTNPGLGVWRQSNAAAVFVDPTTGAPTGFDAAGVIQGRPGIDLNYRDVTTFSLTHAQQALLVANVPLSAGVGSAEARAEIAYVRAHGQDSAPVHIRSEDQTAQALYYKQDAEIFVNELARVASAARHLSLSENATLFALLDGTIADARISAFDSKYAQKYWRPITAINADADGTVRNGYKAWHPLAATPSHPSNTAGHSTTGAAAAEVLRSFFGTDHILPSGKAATLTSLAWLRGGNAGTGRVSTRSVSTFSQVQLENGASRLYLGVHFGFDNYQGQLLGLAVADTILLHSEDPAAEGLRVLPSQASFYALSTTLLAHPDLYGFFAKSTAAAHASRRD